MAGILKNSILCFALFIISHALNAQLASIDCICELEALILDSKIDASEVVIQESEDGLVYTWYVEELVEVVNEPQDSSLLVQKSSVENDTRSSTQTIHSSRLRTKRKKRKNKVKRKTKFKKYKGGCPRW